MATSETVEKISEQTEKMESSEEQSKLYCAIFQKHLFVNANIKNGDSMKINRTSIEKIFKLMPEKLKYGISYIIFSITSTEMIEEVETTNILKKMIKKHEFNEDKECYFLTQLTPSTKLHKGSFNTNIFKNLEKILNIQKEKEKESLSVTEKKGGMTTMTTTTKSQKGGKQTIITETVTVEETIEVEEIREVQTKTVTKSKATTSTRKKKKEEEEEAPQSEAPQSDAPTKKGKRAKNEEREETTMSSKETQKPTRPKKEEVKQSVQEPKKELERRQIMTTQTYPSQAYAFYSSNSNGLQLPHKYRTHPRLYGKDSRACRVCNNTHGLIRKYKLDICRRCFRERATLLGWKQDR